MQHHAVQLQGKVREFAGHDVLGRQLLRLYGQLVCPVGNTAGNVLGLYDLFQFHDLVGDVLFLVLYGDPLDLVKDLQALLVKALLVEDGGKIELFPDL